MTDDLIPHLLSLWGLQDSHVSLIAKRENHVFRVDTAGGRSFALRLHRKGYQTRAAICSELAWMTDLRAAGLPVPQPVPARGGAVLHCADGQFVDLLTWLDGSPLGHTGRPLIKVSASVFHEIGRLMAKVHQRSDKWDRPAEFERPDWNIHGLLGERPVWGRFWDNPRLSDAERAVFKHLRQQAWQVLEHSDLDYGLIHADMLRENILIHDQQPSVIDFDDCGFGFRLFDMATLLLNFEPEPEFVIYKSAFIKGYQGHRAIDLKLLDLFAALRAASYVGWSVPRITEAGAAERERRFVDRALRHARQWLATQP